MRSSVRTTPVVLLVCVQAVILRQEMAVHAKVKFRCGGNKLKITAMSTADVDECLLDTHNCTLQETCFNTRGGFRCVEIDCPEHYTKLANR